MIEFFIIGTIFMFSYILSFFINFDSLVDDKPIKTKKISPKDKSNFIQKKLVEEYLYWLFNSEYLKYKDYPTLFPYVNQHYNPKTKLDWQEIFIEIKKDLHHLI